MYPRADKPGSTVGNGMQGIGHHKQIDRLCDYITGNRPAIQSAHNVCNKKEIQTTEVPEGAITVHHSSDGRARRFNVTIVSKGNFSEG